MKAWIPVLLIALSLSSRAEKTEEKKPLPVLYTGMEETPDEDDLAIQKTYGPRFLLKNNRKEKDFVQSHIVEAPDPVAKDDNGHLKRGFVLVAYIVRKDGTAAEPCVLKSTDKSLESEALRCASAFRFAPATLDGAPVDSIAATPLYFKSDEVPPVEKPVEFITRELDPLHGKITMPKNWHYERIDQPHGFRWIIAKEDPSFGQPYVTGMSIQLFVGIKERSGKTPEQFVLENYRRIRGASKNVIRSWEPTTQGMFTRIGIEVEDEKFHVIYSFFYTDGSPDMAAVTVSGAAREQWKDYEAAFTKMSEFSLIDPSRLLAEKEGKSAPKEVPAK